MGVLNITPDSFSDGGRYFSKDGAVAHAIQMISEGAKIIDVGGESTRPFSQAVSEEEEKKRIIPVISELREHIDANHLDILVSIDTRKPRVAEAALEVGANMINDINALRAIGMAELAANHKVPIVLMHMQGAPEDMQHDPHYDDVVREIIAYLEERKRFAMELGIDRERIILDPGIGFGKTTEHNLMIMNRLSEFSGLGQPVLIGTSNKSFIGRTLDLPVGERLEGTLATIVLSVWNEASIIRVHEVKAAKRVIEMTLAIKNVFP